MKQDHEFEKSFSELAYSALQNSYPDLLQKSVGFQLVDSNDENTKALGLFAINLSGKHYYIPVFFVGGKLKPLELIYDKEKDQFLPLERDWISLISKPDMMDMGQSVKPPKIGLSNPNLEPYANPPRTGRTVTSSAQMKSALDDMLKVASGGTKPLPLFLALAKPLVKKAYLSFMKDNPEYTEKLLEHYDWDIIKQACLTNTQKFKPRESKDEFYIVEDLLDKKASVENAKAVLEDGICVIDKRAGMSSDAYFTDAIAKFETVKDTGIYKIMDSQGDVRNYLVIQNTHDTDKNNNENNLRHAERSFPGGCPPQYSKVCVVDLKDGKLYRTKAGSEIMGQRNHDERHLMDTILKALPNVTEMRPGNKYVLVMKQGYNLVSSGCFEIMGECERDGCSEYQARCCYSWKRDPVKLLIRPNGTKSIGRPRDRVITMTADVKAIPIKSVETSDKFHCQSPKTLEVQAYDKGLNKVEVSCDGIEYSIQTVGHQKSSLTKKAAIETLCLGMNMKSSDALRLVKEAKDHRRTHAFVKQAVGPYDSPPAYGGPQYSPMPMAQMTNPPQQAQQYWPEQYWQEKWQTPTPIGPRDGFSVGIGQENMAQQPQHMNPSQAMQGAQTGDKDILNAGTISSMAAFNDIDDLIDSYLPDLQKALDKIGRMIFMYWYKTDKFADKYTDTEIKETEDMLRNLFKELGKTIYKFKTSKSETYNLMEH